MSMNEHPADENEEMGGEEAGEASDQARETPQGAHTMSPHSSISGMAPMSANIGHNLLPDTES